MIKTIIYKELLEHLQTRKFVWTFAVCSILILVSFYIGAANYEINLDKYNAAKAENLRQFSGLTDWLQVTGHHVFLPPSPLESIITGVSNDIGRTSEIYSQGELTSSDSRYSNDPLFAVFRFLDLTYIFQIILSIFAILFTYDAVNGEKQQGTLRLTFSNPVPKDKYIIGKITGSFLAIALPLMLPLLLGCLILIFMGIELSLSEWIQLLLVILAGLVYFNFFQLLSFLSSIVIPKPSLSFLSMLILWLLFVFVIPNASVLVAGKAVNVPSIDYLDYQKSRLRSQLLQEDRKKMAQFNPINTRDPEKMIQEFQEFMQDLGDKRNEKMMDFAGRLNEDRQNKKSIQKKVALGIAKISPAALFGLASSTISGTSIDLDENFIKNVQGYQTVYQQFMKEKTGILLDQGTVMMKINDDGENQPPPIDINELPGFVYKPISISKKIKYYIVNLSILLVLNALCFTGALIAFLKYDVR